MRFALPLLLLLSSCAVSVAEMDAYEQITKGRITPHVSRDYNERVRLADAVYECRSRARKARKQDEQWCSNRSDNMKVCRVPSWEDFAARSASCKD